MAFLALGAFGLAPILGGILQSTVPGPAGPILGTIFNPLSLLTGALGGGQQQQSTTDYSGVIQMAEYGVIALVGGVVVYKLVKSGNNSSSPVYYPPPQSSGSMSGYNPSVMMQYMR